MSLPESRRLLPAILAALLLRLSAPGDLHAAAPDTLQEALGGPPPPELAPPPGQDPFREKLRRSAPFIDLRETPMRPLSAGSDPPGFTPLPMTGTQGPQNPRPPHVAAPQAPGPVSPASPLGNSTSGAPRRPPPGTAGPER